MVDAVRRHPRARPASAARQPARRHADAARAQAPGARPRARHRARACSCSTRSPAASPKPSAHVLVETIRGIKAAGVTIVWIEHIVHALVAVVDRLVVLNFGRKIAEGEPRTVMASAEVREIYLGIAGRDAAPRDARPHRLLRRLPGAVRHHARGRGGRDGGDHRRQRRRQVDLPEDDRRPACAARPGRSASTARRSAACAPSTSCAAASRWCRRAAACSRRSPSRRTS